MSRLDNVQLEQLRDHVSWLADSGYLNIVTDDRDENYWRIYIGQSKNPIHRIRQHVRAIHSGNSDTLHYFVINQGKGYRRASFVKLWSIMMPDYVNSAVNITLNNITEMTMARAFQSLPPKELMDVFGPPDEGAYRFIGLNIMSPLLQGRSLSPGVRREFSLQLSQSEDPDIQMWPEVRIQQLHRKNLSFPDVSFARLTETDCYDAMKFAVRSLQGVQMDLDYFRRKSPRTKNDDINRSWLEDHLKNIPELNTGGMSPYLPVGDCDSPIGIILGEEVWGVGNESKISDIPIGLQQSGFNTSNCLVWSFSFRRLRHLNPGIQLHTQSPHQVETLCQLNRKLLQRSQLQVVLVCDEVALQALLKNTSARAIEFKLKSSTFKAWLEIEDGKIHRIYIASPPPLTALWVNSWPQAVKISTLFRFAAILTGTKGIVHHACCCQLVTLQIIRQYDREKNGHLKWTAEDMDPNVRAWLKQKGFVEVEDVKKLESLADSMTHALLMLTHKLPKSPIKRETMIKRSKQDRSNIFNQDQLSEIGALLEEVSSQNRPSNDSSEGMPKEDDGMGLVSQDTINEQQELEQDRVEMGDPEVDDGKIQIQVTAGKDNLSKISDSSTSIIRRDMVTGAGARPRKQSSRTLGMQMTLLSGEHISKVELRRRESGFCRVYAGKLAIHFFLDKMIHDKFPNPESLGHVRIKAEISPPEEEFPDPWAKDSQEDDPARRLRFLITLPTPDGEDFDIWPQAKGESAAKRANSFVDMITGVDNEEIASRPRRYLKIDGITASNILKPFTGGGAYTDDNGNVIPKKKRARQDMSGDEEVEGKKRRIP